MMLLDDDSTAVALRTELSSGSTPSASRAIRVLHLDDEEDLEEIAGELPAGESSCPRCGELRWERSSRSCKACGLIFERWRAVQARRRGALRAAVECKARRMATSLSAGLILVVVGALTHLIATDRMGLPDAFHPGDAAEAPATAAVDMGAAVARSAEAFEARASSETRPRAPSPNWESHRLTLRRIVPELEDLLGHVSRTGHGDSASLERLRRDHEVLHRRIDRAVGRFASEDWISMHATAASVAALAEALRMRSASPEGYEGIADDLEGESLRMLEIARRSLEFDDPARFDRFERDPRIRREVLGSAERISVAMVGAAS